MPQPLANIWDIVALPTAIRTTVGTVVNTVMVVNIATAVIVTAVGAILATIGIVIVILTVVMAATANGAGARLLVVIRPITADAGVTPEVLPEAVAQLVRQGTLMAPMTAPAGKFDSNYLSMWRFLDVLGFRTNIVAGQG